MLLHCLLACVVTDENSAVTFIFVPLNVTCHFFLSAFIIFLFMISLVFAYDMLDVIIFVYSKVFCFILISVCLYFHQVHNIFDNYFSQNFCSHCDSALPETQTHVILLDIFP